MAAVVIMGIMSVGCSSDDGGDSKNGGDQLASLVGVWNCEEGDSKVVYEFKADGTCSCMEYIGGSLDDSGQGVFVAKDNKLTMILKFIDEAETLKYTIKTIKKGSTLVLVDEEDAAYTFNFGDWRGSDDNPDGENNIKASDLIGGCWVYGHDPQKEDRFFSNKLEFYADGTYSYRQIINGQSEQRQGKYVVKDDVLILDFGDYEKAGIIKFLKKKSRLVLINNVGDGDSDTYINTLDTDNDSYNVADLVGGWECLGSDGDFVFRADGTCDEIITNTKIFPGTYTIKGNKLRVYDKTYEEEYVYRIISLQKGKELILLDNKYDTRIYRYDKSL